MMFVAALLTASLRAVYVPKGPKFSWDTLPVFSHSSNSSARQVPGVACTPRSQGCLIGCPYCMTDLRHPSNNGTIPTKQINGNPPHADKAGFRKSYCSKPTTQSVLTKEYWTLNLHAVPGAVNSYRFNPWRGPGSAHVVDSCGQAGCKYQITPMGGASAFDTVTVNGSNGVQTLKMGDLRSKVLPPSDPETVPNWKVGSTPRVAWGTRFNQVDTNTGCVR